MNKITLKSTGGPYGDECCSYDFKLSKEMSFKDFVELIVATNPKEWGYIKDRFFGNTLASYNHKDITYHIEDTSFLIKDFGSAHGGWSRMDYIIHRKEI